MTTVNMSRLKYVCMSGNMLECLSGTFAHWATLGRFDHEQGKCILHGHIVSSLRTLRRGAVLSVLSIYCSGPSSIKLMASSTLYICIKLPASAFVSQLVAKYAHTFGYFGL